MRVCVNVLDARLVDVRMGVSLGVVRVLMLVLDVVVVMRGMRMDVGLVLV